MERARFFLMRLGRALIFPLGFILAVSILCSFIRSFDLLFFLFGILVLAIWLCVAIVRTGIFLWNKNWLGALAIIASVGLTVLLVRPLLLAGDDVHLAVMYPYYQGKVAAANGDRMLFDWGGDGFAGSTTDYYLVYDRSGTLQKTRMLQLSAGAPELTVSVRHLFASFYLASYS